MSNKTKIEKSAENCRKAFAKYPDAKWAWCCHHKVFYEELTEPAESRIANILTDKPESERVVRLNNFRPVRDEKTFKPLSDKFNADYKTLRDKFNADCKQLRKPILKVYKMDVPLGTWNGKSIFGN